MFVLSAGVCGVENMTFSTGDMEPSLAYVGDRRDAYTNPSSHSRSECIFKWVLRLMLPTVFVFCGVLFYWICFDDVYGCSPWCFVGGIPVALTNFGIGLWTWHMWLPGDVF